MSKLMFLSQKNFLRIISCKTALCLSQSSFKNGDSAAVFSTIIFNNSHMSLKSLLLDSPSLSLKNLEGGPNTDIQIFKRTLIFCSLCLEATKFAAENLVV